MRGEKEMITSKRVRLLEEIQELKAKLHDREAALPAHTVRPHQVQEIEELEEKIASLERKLGKLSVD
jgi:chromosome segregation ATPase